MTRIASRPQRFEEAKGVIKALHEARKPNGQKYLLREILEVCGLPSDHNWERSLSNWLTQQGIRRVAEFKHKREDGGLIPPMEEIPTFDAMSPLT